MGSIPSVGKPFLFRVVALLFTPRKSRGAKKAPVQKSSKPIQNRIPAFSENDLRKKIGQDEARRICCAQDFLPSRGIAASLPPARPVADDAPVELSLPVVHVDDDAPELDLALDVPDAIARRRPALVPQGVLALATDHETAPLMRAHRKDDGRGRLVAGPDGISHSATMAPRVGQKLAMAQEKEGGAR